MSWTRREGAIRNLANQLSQIATGWEISFDGPALVDQPNVGAIVIDVVKRTATVNGRSLDLALTTTLHGGMAAELARQRLDWKWVQDAQVTITYRRSAEPFSETKYEMSSTWAPWSDHGLFDAVANVSTADGSAEGRSHNDQPLLRVRQPPGTA
jgi:hypothetical protein